MPYSKAWIAANPEQYISANRARVMRYRNTDKGKFYALREVAKRRGLENTLTVEEFLGLLEVGQCYWCEGAVPKTRAGLDRLDNSKGYVNGNCVRCCWSCNVMKAQMTAGQFIEHCQKIIAVAEKRVPHGTS